MNDIIQLVSEVVTVIAIHAVVNYNSILAIYKQLIYVTAWACENWACISAQITHVQKTVLFLVTVYDKHILQNVSALLLIYQCRMKMSVTYLEYF